MFHILQGGSRCQNSPDVDVSLLGVDEDVEALFENIVENE